MRTLFTLFQKTMVGVSIDSDQICITQLRWLKQKVKVEKFALVDLPIGVVFEGKIKQPKLVISILAQLIDQLQLQRYPAAIALPLNSVITKRIKLPIELNEEECELAIDTQLPQYFPGMQDPLCHSFALLPTQETENHDILLASARAEQLNEYVSVVNQAGLIVKIVDIDCYALARAVRRVSQEEVIAILCFNQKEALFIILQNEEVIFSQSWLVESLQKLMQQIKQAIQLVSLSHPYSTIKGFILAGNIPYLSSSTEFFQDELMLPVINVTPFVDMEFSENIDQQKLNRLFFRSWISCGLALRRMV